MADPIDLVAALDHPNVKAFLWMLRHGEGTQDEDGFRRMFGGDLFDSFADHPRKLITKSLGGKPISSTAAGAPQFLARTWDGLVKQYGFSDFSPKNQELGAVALIKGRKALEDVMSGRFESAVMKCNKEWASLPGSPYGQPVVTMARARAEYEEAGGTYADVPAATVTPQPSALATFAAEDTIPPNPFAQDAAMPIPALAPFVAAALPHLIELVPKLGTLFSSGSETSQRNIEAATIVVNAAKEAIGAANEQELVESIKSDPNAAAAAKEAIESAWFSITEVGGGIQAARVAAERYMQPGAAPFEQNPAFWISLLLLVFPLMLAVDIFYVHPGNYDDNLRTQIVTGLLMTISMVGGFWLGSSMGSARKDSLLSNSK